MGNCKFEGIYLHIFNKFRFFERKVSFIEKILYDYCLGISDCELKQLLLINYSESSNSVAIPSFGDRLSLLLTYFFH